MTRHRFVWLPAVLALSAVFALLGTACEEAQQLIAYIDSISDGASCASNNQCLSGRCLTAEQGYPGGYCTTLNCEESGCIGLRAECFRTTIGAQETTACYERCAFDGTCGRAREGYQCLTLADTPVCLPPGTSGATVQGVIGSSCSTSAQCNGEGASCLQTFFGGYCTILGCVSDANCPDAEPCVALNPQGATEEERQLACMAGCAQDSDCRFGYACASYEGRSICLESDMAGSKTRNPDGADDGAACVSNINCKGATCIREVESASGGTSYPGGYCTTRACESDADCNGASSVCISRESATSCRVRCQRDAECRQGYSCVEGTLGASYCDSTQEPAMRMETSSSQSIAITCTQDKTITFTTPPDSVGFFFGAYTQSASRIMLSTLRKPDGSTLDIQKDYSFLTINQSILGNLAPILFPASDEPAFAEAFGGGSYTLTMDTRAVEVCYYVVPQPREGRTLALNLYFVGVPGVTAAQAANNADIQAMLRHMRAIYQKMGITVEIKNYIAASAEVQRNYSVVRDFYDVFNLVATSTSPGESQRDALSVNVFLIEDFNVSDVPGLLGVSTGIPGMAGFHGSSSSGLVFSTASLGSDNLTLGQVLAHEVGHYLGLRHTTEHLGASRDPISDTPSCRAPDLGFLCPDATNFMFPFAMSGERQTIATPGQGFVLRRNPMVQP